MRKVFFPSLVIGLILCAGSSAYAQDNWQNEFSDNNLPGAVVPMASDQFNQQGNFGLNEEVRSEKAKEEEAEYQIKVREALIDASLNAILPLKPEEIRKTLEAFKTSREAVEEPITIATPEMHIETISLDPAVTPPVIKLAAGYVTTISILDMTGAAWPIQDIAFAGPFQVEPPEEGENIFRIIPSEATHGVGNVSIRLVDLITPITFTLRSQLETSYYRFDARIPKMGPLAKIPLIDEGGLTAVAGGDVLVNILEGSPPMGANPLKVTGLDGRTKAWEMSGKIYLRTPFSLLSPSWVGSVTSADGMKVYTLKDTPVLLLSDNGRMVQAHLSSEGAM